MRNLTITLGLIIFALAGFYAGARYESTRATPVAASTPAAAATGAATGATRGAGGGFAGASGGGAGAGAGGFGRGTFGQVTAISGATLTLQDAQGNQVKVQLSPSTTISKSVSGSQSDLASGQTVTVAGQRGADGTIAATAITIVPASNNRG